MLIPFAYCFRRRPSGTGNNEPPTSLFPLSGLVPRSSGGEPQDYPANRRLVSLMRA